MNRFIFSMDAHVSEPKTLWQDKLPFHLRSRALRSQRDEKYINMIADNKVLHRMQIGDNNTDHPRLGSSDLELRLQDMAQDGIDGELIYPNLGTMIPRIEDPELALASVQVYNDWAIEKFSPYPEVFVASALLPMVDAASTLAELKRVHALGYRTATLPIKPAGDLRYNDPSLEPIWEYAEARGIVLTFHISTGLVLVQEKGPGAAVINYTKLSFENQNLVAYFVCSGVLDRHPKLKIVVVEAGASWIAALGERMDESYTAHNYYVRPKLSRMPSEILYSQVVATFQYDRACFNNIPITGHKCMVWASDYPHMEGTFPHSRKVVAELFADNPELSEQVKADILGGTAAELFGITPRRLEERRLAA